MPCNIAKCRELVAQKKNKADTAVNGLKQVNKLKTLGVTFQENNRFNTPVKNKLMEAIRCLFVLRTLRQKGYMYIHWKTSFEKKTVFSAWASTLKMVLINKYGMLKHLEITSCYTLVIS